ncbi:MAG: hypothetical protein KKC55_15210 [Gammaproteobacteria bacterium]|nr:hypothetical protein [Gammaproteobacteria bacterium]
MSVREEQYQEWLDRLEIPIEEQSTIEDFQEYLKAEFLFGDAQVEALSGAFSVERDFEKVGIHAVTVTYPWGKDLRYGISGAPGLWGFESAMRFYGERTEAEE